MRALRAFRERPEARSLVEANKRIRNILRKAEQAGGELDRSLLADGPEAELADAVEGLADSVARALDRRDYQASLAALAELAGPLDRFFDAVMVMADDERLRGNRIALLDRARALFLDIADLSRLQTD
jgi:glycyl-tRNA synthetase beta chain